MGESIWVTFKAKVPATWVPDANDLPEALETGPDLFELDVEDGDGWTVITYNGEGNYGSQDTGVQAFIEWCGKHRVPYACHDEGKYEYPATDQFFDGTDSWDGTSAGEEPVLTLSEWSSIVLSVGDNNETVCHAIARHFERLSWQVRDADISHLPAEYPEENE